MSEQEAMRRFRAVRDDVAERLRRLEGRLASPDLPAWFGRDGDRRVLGEARERLEDARFVVAVVGEFSSGKSFLLNALLGKVSLEREEGLPPRLHGLLATDINPSTATITELEYGTEESAAALYPSGREERIPLDRLSRFVAVGSEEGGPHDATTDADAAPTHVRVRIDSPFLAGGFVVADTPGLASINPAHRRATLAYLPGADAVLYLIDTQQPFTEGDAAFLGIVRSHIESLFIVQTKIDLWRALEGGEEEAWHAAYRRIAALAGQHAPGTPTYPLSAREYAEGALTGDEALVEQSRFPEFLAALDRSLVASAGRNRLRRALAAARAATARALHQIDLDAAALPKDERELRALRESVLPQVEAAELAARGRRSRIAQGGAEARERIGALGREMAGDLERALSIALDAAAINRLRDRAKLHQLVDAAVARVGGQFAHAVGAESTRKLEELARAGAGTEPDAVVADLLARRFGAEPGTGAWAHEASRAVAGSIVLRAIGGPSVAFVHAVSTRFASGGQGKYMKRELLQDLRSSLFPVLRGDVVAFTAEIAEVIAAAYDDLDAAVAREAERARDERLGTLDRVIAQHADAARRGARLEELQRLRSDLSEDLRAIEEAVETFSVDAERAPFDAAAYRAAVERDEERAPFDAEAYGLGLRPERWRVVVLGAFRRGKSSLINCVAGRRILGDEVAGEVAAFPVHVRYGPAERASALQADGTWKEIPYEEAVDHAARAPVLIEVPWRMPKQLVLVHAPAFDTGDERAEEMCLTAAAAASEVLCLFSRQLSDRELELYQRVAELGKELLFVHTMADNEQSGDRRKVVELAARYLRERNIAAGRIFTISTREYRLARRDGRAPAGWNEVDALVTTLESHADAHMRRLERARREQERVEAQTAKSPEEDAAPRAGGLGAALRGLFKRR
ncbi:MAG TPA: dynamin family protein [Candidatus Dormibacteraeota bacterium]|nr:dynamin family protein [Candidatus Dormibacteraeota bacterium]